MVICAEAGLRVENGETALAARCAAIATTGGEHGWADGLEFHFGPRTGEMRILKNLGSGKSILVEMGIAVFFGKSAELHEKKRDTFLMSARKCKKVQKSAQETGSKGDR